MAEVVFRCKCGWEEGKEWTEKMEAVSKKTMQIEIVCPKCGKSARPVSPPRKKTDKWYSMRKDYPDKI